MKKIIRQLRDKATEKEREKYNTQEIETLRLIFEEQSFSYRKTQTYLIHRG